jgi:hypothetical protein
MTGNADSSEANRAYQVLGEGPLDVLHVAMGNVPIDCMWDEPGLAGGLRRLASFSRLITCDLVGFGSSDTVPSAALPAMHNCRSVRTGWAS